MNRAVNVTGDDRINDILERIVSVYVSELGEAIRSIYLVGSYADGTAIPESDIDCYVIFSRSPVDEGDIRKGQEIATRLRADSPVWLDIGLVDRCDLCGDLRFHLGSVHLHGPDIRTEYSLPLLEAGKPEYLRNMLLRCAMIRKTEQLDRLLDYPDPGNDYKGYIFKSNLVLEPGPKVLVHHICWIATALLSLEHNTLVGSRGETVRRFAALEPASRGQFVKVVHDTCKMEWGWKMPAAPEQCCRLREICEGVLSFERSFIDSACRIAPKLDWSDEGLKAEVSKLAPFLRLEAS